MPVNKPTRPNWRRDGDITEMAKDLAIAWGKYTQLLGEPPHGTVTQFKAMLQFTQWAKQTSEVALDNTHVTDL